MPTTTKSQVQMMKLRLLGLATALALATAVASATPAHAAFSIAAAGGSATNPDGTRNAQAGGHPDFTTNIEFSSTTDSGGALHNDGGVKDVDVALPPGVIGNPTVTPVCDVDRIKSGGFFTLAQCPTETQVGVADVTVNVGGYAYSALFGVYNLEAPRGAPALFGFNAIGVVVLLRPELRGGDFGLNVHTEDVSQSEPVVKTKITLWGVPADPAHDGQRFLLGGALPGDASGNPLPSGLPPKAFMTAPTECAGPQTTTIRARSWEHQDLWTATSFDTDFNGLPLQAEGCGSLPFAPTIGTTLESRAADAPSGLGVDLSVPQDGLTDPAGLGTAHLKDVTVTLPEGVTINPGSAEGLQSCTDAQLGLGDTQPVACPAAAKIGTVKATTPLLADAMEGAVYLRPQASDDPESGDMFRLALVLDNAERGIHIKLAGSVRVNATTGQIQTTFLNNPRLPVSKLELRLKPGSRGPLATPTGCGAKPVQTDMTSWGGQALTRPTQLDIACPGSAGFAPAFTAGAAVPRAGASSALAVRIDRADRQEYLDGVTVQIPPGLLATLKGVPQCAEADAAAGTCAATSRVGSATVGAGPGSDPFYLRDQPVYLGGPYKGAPFSLAVVTHAVAGPFDLGKVIVRQALNIDPIDAHVTVVSDPLPTILKGVPLRLRSVDVRVDRPGFTLNPTSCAPTSIGGVLHSVAGTNATVASRFQVGDCASLALKPSLGLTLSGKGQTTDGGHPAVSATLTQPAGGANLKKVRVALPLSLALDPDNSVSDGLCSFVEGSKPLPVCPASSVVGRATAVTPILNQPLSGPVYFVKNERKDPKSGRSIKTTPKLVIPLTGENGVKLTLTGASTVVDDQLVTTFDNIPDAPVSSFKLDINGGKKGILVVSAADICKATQIADQQVDGQNGKAADADVSIQTPSCPLKIITKAVTAKSVAVKIGGLGAGKVTVSGQGIKKTVRTIAKSTVATVTAKRTEGKPGKVTVSFDPTGPAKARKTTK